MQITINGINWEVKFVNPESRLLIDNDGNSCLGLTFLNRGEIYIGINRPYDMVKRTVIHEISHAVLATTQITNPANYTEEDIVRFVASYGKIILEATDKVMEEYKYET